MRAYRLLTSKYERGDKALTTIAMLCEERTEEILPPLATPLFTPGNHHTTSPSTATTTSPATASVSPAPSIPVPVPEVPAQPPYSVGSGSRKSTTQRDRLSPPKEFFEGSTSAQTSGEEESKEMEKIEEEDLNEVAEAESDRV